MADEENAEAPEGRPLPINALSRGFRLAALPMGFAGRTTLGVGKRLAGAPAAAASIGQVHRAMWRESVEAEPVEVAVPVLEADHAGDAGDAVEQDAVGGGNDADVDGGILSFGGRVHQLRYVSACCQRNGISIRTGGL